MSYTVTYEGSTPDVYRIKAQASGSAPQPTSVSSAKNYAWSKRSVFYHDANCPDVKRILAENLVQNDTPPSDKKLAQCVTSSN